MELLMIVMKNILLDIRLTITVTITVIIIINHRIPAMLVGNARGTIRRLLLHILHILNLTWDLYPTRRFRLRLSSANVIIITERTVDIILTVIVLIMRVLRWIAFLSSHFPKPRFQKGSMLAMRRCAIIPTLMMHNWQNFAGVC
jgi:hypothetical protein